MRSNVLFRQREQFSSKAISSLSCSTSQYHKPLLLQSLPHLPQLNNKHSREVVGLCGNFDGSRYNDRRRPDGALAGSTPQFGDSWAVPGEPDTCQPETCQHKQQAFVLCQKIR